ncbi:UNVERIFIED_CONTAM: hypothetical protein RKD43_000713 [Streptomyces graminofaciens]
MESASGADGAAVPRNSSQPWLASAAAAGVVAVPGLLVARRAAGRRG